MKRKGMCQKRFLLFAALIVFLAGCTMQAAEPIIGQVGTPREFKAARAAIKDAQFAGANVDKAQTLMAKAEKEYRACNTEKGLALANKAKQEADNAKAALEKPKAMVEAPKPAHPVAAPVAAAPVMVEKKIVLRGINFDFDKADIKPEFEPVLDEAVSILKENPGIHVEIAGHTCNMGPEQYNQRLSERRANSVKKYFVERGIDAKRLKAVGYGESKPITDNSTIEKRRMNRRVELKAIK